MNAGRLIIEAKVKKKRLAVITLSKELSGEIMSLKDSLSRQSDKNFTWHIQIKAPLSKEAQKSLQKLVDSDVDVSVRIDQDSGIYDALNIAISKISEDYYLVVGEDDVLEMDAVRHVNMAIDQGSPDAITFPYIFGQTLIQPGRGRSYLRGPFSAFAGHAVSSVFRKDLHQEIGLYDTSYKIAADYKFMLSFLKASRNLEKGSYIMGIFSTSGVSGRNIAASGREAFRAKKEVYGLKLIDWLVFLLRLAKWRIKS